MTRSMIGDPDTCRDRAFYCARLGANCASREVAERLANISRTWLYLSVQLDEYQRLFQPSRQKAPLASGAEVKRKRLLGPDEFS